MIIAGTSVPGIFTFEAGLEYEVGDIILYNDILYSVIYPYQGSTPPDVSPSCKPYVVRHATTDISDLSSTDLVLASTFQLLLNSFFDGLNLHGEIDTIRTSEVNIDNLTTTGAHILRIDSLCIIASLLPTDRTHLIRVYKSNNVIIQEIIDYESPAILYRTSPGQGSPNWDNWVMLSNSGNVDSFKSNLSTFLSKVSSVIGKIHTLEDDHRVVFRDVPVPFNNGNVSITDDLFLEGIILNIGFEYEFDGNKYQEFVSFDLSGISQSTAYNTVTNSGKKVYMYKINANTINIQLLDVTVSNPKIIRILASKKYPLV